ncbi:MAG: hypothetical protein J7501_15180 [Bdellovibrio sp.]|nr:hypothetical protein [Bdellovibrio sp.]
MKILSFVLVLLGPFLCRASLFTSPVGHREAFLGNAGSALVCSSGSAIYNPAGIGFCSHDVSISLSGTGISYQELDGTVFSRNTGSLKSTTLLTSAIFSIEDDLHMGLYYSYPVNWIDYFRVNDSTTSYTQEIQRQAAIAGISYGGMLTNNFAWGFSIGMSWSEMNSGLVSNTESAGTASTFTQRVMQEENYIVLNPGLLWKANDAYSLGFTVQWRAINLYSEADVYTSSLSTGQTTISEVFQRYTPHAQPLLGLTLGQVLNFGSQQLLFDWTHAPQYSLPSTQQQVSDDIKYDAVSLGWQMHILENADLLLGGNYSQYGELKNYLTSIGFAFKKRTYEASLGLYKQTSKNDAYGGQNSDTMGFLYSSTLSY